MRLTECAVYLSGLEDIHLLTADGRRHQLRVEMVAANGTHYYEEYDDFWIGSARNFQLHIGNYRGTAGNLLSCHSRVTSCLVYKLSVTYNL